MKDVSGDESEILPPFPSLSNISLSSSSISCYANDSSYHEEPPDSESSNQSYAGIGNMVCVCLLCFVFIL